MDTQEARRELLQLGERAFELARRFRDGDAPSKDDRSNLREMVLTARATLPDAGYPGEGIWRGLQRTSMGAETWLDGSDSTFWDDVLAEIESGIDTLRPLVSPGVSRDSDFYVVG
ncbi:MAG TPA: hypothetical protein VF898_08715 [Chloroflexota bacterium]